VHDNVLQRLFGAALVLQSTLACITDPTARERVRHTMTVLDEIIDEVRSVLHPGPTRASGRGQAGVGSSGRPGEPDAGGV
jgi:hypothetical protein